MSHMSNSRRSSRRPSFILVTKQEEEEMNPFAMIGNMGIPILYVIAGSTTLIGIICMSIITKYWAELSPPTCFLYSETASASIIFTFGTRLSTCYWVSYGSIPAVIVCVICALLYIIHVKNDKTVTMTTYVCVVLMFAATIIMLAVVCTLTQGMRITCANITFNPANNKGRSCKSLLDSRVEGFNFPVQTSAMVTVSMATLWLGTCCFMLITIFHIALVVRRTSAY